MCVFCFIVIFFSVIVSGISTISSSIPEENITYVNEHSCYVTITVAAKTERFLHRKVQEPLRFSCKFFQRLIAEIRVYFCKLPVSIPINKRLHFHRL